MQTFSTELQLNSLTDMEDVAFTEANGRGPQVTVQFILLLANNSYKWRSLNQYAFKFVSRYVTNSFGLEEDNECNFPCALGLEKSETNEIALFNMEDRNSSRSGWRISRQNY